MYYRDPDQAAQALIDVYKHAANLYPVIRPVIESFHKKVYNIRLDKALNAISENTIHAKKEYKHICIYLYYNNEIITLATLSLDDLINGKRIDSNKLLESAREYRDEHLKNAYEIKKAMETHETIKEQIKSIGKQLNAVIGQIDNYRAREIYNINARIVNY